MPLSNLRTVRVLAKSNLFCIVTGGLVIVCLAAVHRLFKEYFHE